MTDDDDGFGDSAEPDDADPTRIRSLAVHREDVANALEATLRTDREVVLRVTPPFSGRMRARLHAVEPDDDPAAGTVHVDPRDLVADIPAYPEVDETAADHPDADVGTRRRLHGERVEAWRERVRESVVDAVTLDGDDGTEHAVDVTALG